MIPVKLLHKKQLRSSSLKFIQPDTAIIAYQLVATGTSYLVIFKSCDNIDTFKKHFRSVERGCSGRFRAPHPIPHNGGSRNS